MGGGKRCYMRIRVWIYVGKFCDCERFSGPYCYHSKETFLESAKILNNHVAFSISLY